MVSRATLALSLVLGACAALRPALQAPDVYVIEVTPLEGGMLEQRVRVDLRILNPNDFDMHVTGLDFELEVNETRLARGVSSETLIVPRLGEGVVSVIASTTVFDLVRQFLTLKSSEDLELGYAIRGNLHLERYGRLPFERSSSLRPP